MPYDMNELLRMSPAELDALFAKSPPGPIPDGEAKGVAIPFPGSASAPGIAKIASRLWQGKTFDAKHKTLRNRITPFGVKAIGRSARAEPPDGKLLVLDYSEHRPSPRGTDDPADRAGRVPRPGVPGTG
jgi:hypothetical protein